MKEKKVIGLTGKYCAGKNHVASILEKLGFPVLDLDKLGHQVIENEKERLLESFGTDILGAGSEIDRKKLGEKVFGNNEKLSVLEGIIHPAVNRETMSWIAGTKKTCFINAALLHRSSAFKTLDAVIIVEAPFLVRLLRAKKRDKLPLPVLIRRFRSQRNFHSQYFNGKTDIYRVSNKSARKKTHLESRINKILSLLGIL